MNRLLHPAPALLLAAAFAATLAVSPAAGIPLSEVAEKAKKKADGSSAADEAKLSQNKKKQEAPAPPAPAPTPRDEAVVAVHPLPVLPWGGWQVARHLPIPEENLVPIEEEPGYSEARMRLGAVAGGGGLTDGELDNYGSGGILLGWEEDGWSLDGRAWYSRARASASLDEAFTAFRGWAGDVALRLQLAAPEARFRPNAMIAARIGNYRWDFRNPVTIAELNNRRFEDDSIGFRSLLGGLGVELARGSGWSFGATLAAGYQGFDDTTDAGFDNDLFDGGAVFELVGELVFAPSR